MRLRGADFRRILLPHTFSNRKSALCSCNFVGSTELMHRPWSDSSLHFEIKNTYQIRMGKSNASARRLLPAILLECWPQICCVNESYGRIRFRTLLCKRNSRRNYTRTQKYFFGSKMFDWNDIKCRFHFRFNRRFVVFPFIDEFWSLHRTLFD